MDSYEVFPPMEADNPAIGTVCAVCAQEFKEGDIWTYCAGEPSSEEEAALMEAGDEYEAIAVAAHASCRIRILEEWLEAEMLEAVAPEGE